MTLLQLAIEIRVRNIREKTSCSSQEKSERGGGERERELQSSFQISKFLNFTYKARRSPHLSFQFRDSPATRKRDRSVRERSELLLYAYVEKEERRTRKEHNALDSP